MGERGGGGGEGGKWRGDIRRTGVTSLTQSQGRYITSSNWSSVGRVSLCRFGVGGGRVELEEVVCEGGEAHLLRCRYSRVGGGSTCQHQYDIAVACCKLPLCSSILVSIHLSIGLSVCPFCLLVCVFNLSLCPSCLSVCLFVCLSLICLSHGLCSSTCIFHLSDFLACVIHKVSLLN